MEDTLGEMGQLIKGSELGVLILVLMEDTLGGEKVHFMVGNKTS